MAVDAQTALQEFRGAEALRLYAEGRYGECAPYIKEQVKEQRLIRPFFAACYDIVRWDLDGNEHSLWDACVLLVSACALGDESLGAYLDEELCGGEWRAYIEEDSFRVVSNAYLAILSKELNFAQAAGDAPPPPVTQEDAQ